MPSKNKTCVGKARYDSYGIARATSLLRLAEGPEIYLRVYHCEFCRKYHLTSKRPEEARNVNSSASK